MPFKIQTWPPFFLARNHLQEVTLMASTISSTPIDFEEENSKISFLILFIIYHGGGLFLG